MVQPVLVWQAGRLTAIRPETRQTKSFTFALPKWMAHRPGQHYDVRLTAPDGYQTQRSYSIASPPERVGEVELTVERIPDGEVSPYLHDVLTPGDQLEVRGPIGGYFVWDVSLGGPLLLIAGGSGIVPLMAMLRHRNAVVAATDAERHRLPARLLYSSRGWDEVIYRDELTRLAEKDTALEVRHTLTRDQPQGWSGFRRRVDRAMLEEVAWPPSERPRIFVCGPTALVESA